MRRETASRLPTTVRWNVLETFQFTIGNWRFPALRGQSGAVPYWFECELPAVDDTAIVDMIAATLATLPDRATPRGLHENAGKAAFHWRGLFAVCLSRRACLKTTNCGRTVSVPILRDGGCFNIGGFCIPRRFSIRGYICSTSITLLSSDPDPTDVSCDLQRLRRDKSPHFAIYE